MLNKILKTFFTNSTVIHIKMVYHVVGLWANPLFTDRDSFCTFQASGGDIFDFINTKLGCKRG